MKTFINKIVTCCIFIIFSINLFAQELPEQYRENFTESFPIRKEQRLEMKSYVAKLINENANKSLNLFQPDYFSIENYKSSLFPYRTKLGNYFGYPPQKTTHGKITKFIKVGEDKYSDVFRVWVEVVEGVNTYGLYLVPKNLEGKTPMIVAIHGGGGNPEAICGLDTRINYHNFGFEAVKRGYIVWAPALNMNSSYSGDSIVPGAEREILNTQLKQLGSSIIGLEIHKIIESTKTLMLQREEIDKERVGITGLSWGGFFTMNTAALCPFIKVAAPSAYFRDSKADLLAISNPNRKNPTVYSFKRFGHSQIVGMICPRPCMVQMGDKDSIFDMDGTKSEVNRAKQYYDKLGIPENFEFNIHQGGHEFEIESIIHFFDKNL